MSNEEIFARIGKDISDVYNRCFGLRDITIWMTKDLFNFLFPKQVILQEDSATIMLCGCKVRVVLFPCDGMRWIVGYEGKADGDET